MSEVSWRAGRPWWRDYVAGIVGALYGAVLFLTVLEGLWLIAAAVLVAGVVGAAYYCSYTHAWRSVRRRRRRMMREA
jgi:uncharacterized membrane protein YeaQ/YmgE (transglycosylase-associated protein family)